MSISEHFICFRFQVDSPHGCVSRDRGFRGKHKTVDGSSCLRSHREDVWLALRFLRFGRLADCFVEIPQDDLAGRS